MKSLRRLPTQRYSMQQKMAEALGNPKVMNIILLGALVNNMGITDVDWEKVISENVKPQFVDINLEAFKIGMEM